MSEYEDIFEQRGRSYDEAMRKYPNARNKEFERLFDHLDVNKVSSVLDIPSGGGYLQKHLPARCSIECIDPCEEFNPRNTHISVIDLENTDLPENTYDLLVCLAAIHHVKDKDLFLKNCISSLKPGGYFCIGDVVHNSPIAGFLDDFAGMHNGTGHKGNYLHADTLSEIIQNQPVKIIQSDEKPCHWGFDKKDEMLDFCRLLFGLRQVANETLAEALQRYIGFDESETGVQLNWKLFYITLQKEPAINPQQL